MGFLFIVNIMEQAIRTAIVKLFKGRRLKCYVSKHAVERIISRDIDLKKLSYSLNKVADNICLILFECQLKDDAVRVDTGMGFVLTIGRHMKDDLAIITVMRPYKIQDIVADVVL